MHNLHTKMKRRTRFLMARVIPDKTADESVGGVVDGNTIQSTHSKRFIRLLRSIIVLTAALGSLTFRGFVYGTLCNRRSCVPHRQFARMIGTRYSSCSESSIHSISRDSDSSVTACNCSLSLFRPS